MKPDTNSRAHLFCPVAWGLFAAWCAAIFYLSSLPSDELPTPLFGIPGFDKVAHVGAFAVGAALLAAALRFSTAWGKWRIAVVAVLGLALFGATDEWHQLYTPNRSGADPYDWLADVIGAAGAMACYLYAQTRSRIRPR